MTRGRPPTRDAAYFEKIYSKNPDPWNFITSEYERRKYAASIEILGGRRFSHGLEVGCSIGVLTKLLAQHCERLLAVDLSPQALQQATTRCATENHVTFDRMRVPESWPVGQFDLIVLSEVLYFLHPNDIAQVAMLATSSLNTGGVLLLVNYTEDIDEPCSGEEAAEFFIGAAKPAVICTGQMRGNTFRIDLLEKSAGFDRKLV